MTLNELGTLFMIWWITMGVVKGLWDILNYAKYMKELYKDSGANLHMTYNTFQKVVITIELFIWPIILVKDFISLIKRIMLRLKRGF